jgi:hypothetical protein
MPGGRPKGSMNKKSRINIVAAHYDLKPLDHMMTVLNDEDKSDAERMDAAKSAAPYIHPRLAQTQLEVTGDITYDKIEREIVKPKPTNG